MRELTQQVLARAPRGAFTNFVSGETRVGSRRVLTLDFVRNAPDGTVGHCRHYFVIDGNVTYVLGFGTNAPDYEPMFDLFERMAQSFVFEEIRRMSRTIVLILAAVASSLVAAHATAENSGAGGAPATNATASAAPAATSTTPVEMKRYRNEAWKFELDIPKHWSVTPPGADNGELARFMSIENSHYLVKISRHLMRPAQTAQDVVDQNQKGFTAKGYANFVRGETLIGTIRAATLDYQIPSAKGGPTTYWRHYYVIQGPVGYQLAFGTNNHETMRPLFDRVAKSFVFEDL